MRNCEKVMLNVEKVWKSVRKYAKCWQSLRKCEKVMLNVEKGNRKKVKKQKPENTRHDQNQKIAEQKVNLHTQNRKQ